MARGDASAQQAEKTANTSAGTFGGNANSLYSSVAPQLMQDAAHPTGYTPQQEANMTTAAEQGAGGGESAAVGQGALLGARTKNAGAAGAGIAEASRGAQRTLGNNTLGIKMASAGLADQKRSQALSELGGLYGTSAGASNNALGQVASNSEANSKAVEQSWDGVKYILDPALEAAGNSAKLMAGACWIAEAIYGVDDARTHLVRAYLNGPFRDSLIGNAIMKVYFAIGRQVAWLVRRSSILRWLLKPLFDRALESAMKTESIASCYMNTATNTATDL